jgi:hypothetical protein
MAHSTTSALAPRFALDNNIGGADRTTVLDPGGAPTIACLLRFDVGGTRMRYGLFWALVCAAAAGCSSSSGGGSDMGGDMRGGPQTCMSDGQTFQLAGKYGVQALLAVTVKVTPGCSGASCIVNADANAKLLLLTEVNQNGTSATVSAQACKIAIPPIALKGSNQPVRLTAPDSLLTSLPAVMSTGTLDGTTTCARFSSQPITIVLGASLANAFSDALPTYNNGSPTLCGGAASTRCQPAPTDTGCICDQEGDGILGARLNVENAPGFDDIDRFDVDLRTSVSLSGQVWPEAAGQARPGARILGTVENLKLDQNILGCQRNTGSPPAPHACNSSEVATVAGFNPAIMQSANAASTFTAVPMAAGATCADLIANEASLFP